MAEQTPSTPEVASAAQSKIQELSQLLHQTQHLDPQAQEALADLMDELSKAVGPGTTPSAETAHLAASAVHLAQALHHRHDAGLLAAARNRLQDAAIRAEAEVPLATGIVRRLIDTLANLGI